MDLEARSLQPSVKATLLAKLREYKSDLNKLKREVKKLTMPNANQSAHEDLLESGMAGAHEVSPDCLPLLFSFSFFSLRSQSPYFIHKVETCINLAGNAILVVLKNTGSTTKY